MAKTVESQTNAGVHGPFQAKNRYNVRLANRRAPGMCFLLGFGVYLFLAQYGPGIPVVGSKRARYSCFSLKPLILYITRPWGHLGSIAGFHPRGFGSDMQAFSIRG